MSVKYEVLKRLVRAAGIKKRWLRATTEELLENRRKQNAKNRIPALNDDAFEFSRIDVMGYPVLKLIHREHTDRANLFLIGGGMISAPRPASVKSMFHCYPVFPIVKEAKEGWELMARLMKEGTSNE